MATQMKKRSGRAITLICAMAVAAVVLAAPVAKIREIRRPLFSAPVFVKAGGSFDVTLKLDGDKKPLKAALVAVADTYSVVGLALAESGAAPEGTIYAAAVPANAPEALYDLRILFSDGTTDTQPHAVKILKDFKKDFDFVHLTDIHFNDSVFADKDSNLTRIKVLYEVQKVNPEFILFGGDLGLNPVTYDRDFPTGYDILTEYVKSPIFMVPGNHEQYIDGRTKPKLDGRPYWEAIYGLYYQSFTYGKLHFIGLNTFDYTDKWRDRYDQNLIMTGAAANGCIGPKQADWLKKDLQNATSAGDTSIVFTHIPIGMLQGGKKLGFAPPEIIKGPSAEDFSKLMEEYKVPYVFVGHMHYSYDDKKLNPVTTEIMTEAAGTSTEGVADPLWGFRIVHVKDGKIVGWEIRQISHQSAQP
jgi:predicted MPP superfamily phosphohydrolase